MNEILKKNGITFGTIAGLASVLITTLIYTIDITLFTKWWVGIISIIISLSISIYLMIKTKKDLNGNFPFKSAFTTYFISAVIGVLISVAFNIILFNFVDPCLFIFWYLKSKNQHWTTVLTLTKVISHNVWLICRY
jgi:hypothetical protein